MSSPRKEEASTNPIPFNPGAYQPIGEDDQSPILSSSTDRLSAAAAYNADKINDEDDTIHIDTKDGVHVPPSNIKRILAQLLTWAAVGIEPLFAYFLYLSVSHAQEKISGELGMDEIEGLNVAFKIALIALVGLNLAADLTAVNPVEESELLISSNDEAPVMKNNNDYCINYETVYKIGGGLSKITFFAVALPSFINFAASDAVAIADWTDNIPVKIISGALVTACGVAYYSMFSGANIKRHSLEFIERIFAKESTLLSIIRTPLISSEVALQAVSNMLYRSIAGAYIGLSLTQDVFKLSPTHAAVVPWMSIAAGLTLIATAFSRVRQVRGRYFNPEFETLEPEHFIGLGISKLGLVGDALITNTRSASVVWLLSKVEMENDTLKYSIMAAVGVAINAHGHYVSYQTRRNQAALKYRQSLEVNVAADANSTFDKIVEHFKKSPGLNKTITVVNGGARASRWIGFIGFLLGVQKVLAENGRNLNLGFYDTVALAGLWGIPTLVADGVVYSAEMTDVLSYYRAKIAIGAPSKKDEASFAPIRFFKSVFTPKNQYEESKLKEVHDKLTAGETKALIKKNK